MYGDNFITNFKEDIDEMFECKDHDKGANITADIMDIDLRRKYSDDYTLPLLTATRSYVRQLTKKNRPGNHRL